MSEPGAWPPPPPASWSNPPPVEHPHVPPSTTMASWALGLAVIPCGIGLVVSVVLACTVISRSRDGRDHGRGRAVAALVVVGLWVLVIVVAVAVAVLRQPDRDTSGSVVSRGDVLTTDLRPGDCIVDPVVDEVVLTLELVPCTSPHSGEVYAVFDLPAPFTARRDAVRQSRGGCLTRFAAFAGTEPGQSGLGQSGLGVLYYLPETAEQFDDDPTVICVVQSPAPVTGSLEGRGGSGEVPADPPADPPADGVSAGAGVGVRLG